MVTHEGGFGGQQAAVTRLRRHRHGAKYVPIGVETLEPKLCRRKIERSRLILHERDDAVVRHPKTLLELGRVWPARCAGCLLRFLAE